MQAVRIAASVLRRRWPTLHSVRPPHADVHVSKRLVPHPTWFGLEPTTGIPHGQDANYRASLPRHAGSLHIKEYDDHYRVHWDEIDPSEDPIGHLLVDATKYLVALGLVLLGLLASLLAFLFGKRSVLGRSDSSTWT